MESGFMDYNEFKTLLDSSRPTHLYEELIKKEERVLDTINRVVDYSNKKELEAKQFLKMPVEQVSSRFMQTMLDLIQELTKARDSAAVLQAISKDDRIIFLGIFVIMISVFLFFVQNSNLK